MLRIDDPDVAYVLPAAAGGSWQRVEATARALEEAGARVEPQVSDDREHRIRDAAVAGVRALLS